MCRDSLHDAGLAALLCAIALCPGCGGDPSFTNGAPTELSILPERRAVLAGKAMVLSGHAIDPDGDEIFFRWTAAAGSFDPPDGHGESVSWIAPREPGSVAITLHASDGVVERWLDAVVPVAAPLPPITTGYVIISDNGYPYLVASPEPVICVSATTLGIDAGVEMLFQEETGGIEIKGGLIVAGTADRPVSMAPNDAPGEYRAWGGVKICGYSGNGRIAHLEARDATFGLLVEHGAWAEVDSSRIINTYGTAITVWGSGASLRDVVCWYGKRGVVAYDSWVTIEGGSISFNNGTGITTGGGGRAHILDCEIAFNHGSGVDLAIGSGVVMHGCVLLVDVPLSDTECAFRVLPPFPSTSTIDAERNYWGFVTAEEISAIIYDAEDDQDIQADVDFDPWLDARPAGTAAGKTHR